MARPPKKVTLAGKELKKVIAVRMELERGVGDLGEPRGETRPLHVTIWRDASEVAQVNGFENATNEDGHNELVKAEFVIPNAQGRDAYTVKLKRAIVARWGVHKPPGDDQPTREIIELYAGDVSFNAGGQTKTFTLAPFDVQ